MHIEQSPEDIRKERIFSLEAENKRLDVLNDEYIRTISEQATVIRELKLEKFAFTAQCADEIRKLESKSDVWTNLAMERADEIVDQKVTINTLNDHYFEQKKKWQEKEEVWRLRAERQDREWQELRDREIVMGEKIKRLKEYADSIEMSEMCFEVRQLMIKIYDL